MNVKYYGFTQGNATLYPICAGDDRVLDGRFSVLHEKGGDDCQRIKQHPLRIRIDRVSSAFLS